MNRIENFLTAHRTPFCLYAVSDPLVNPLKECFLKGSFFLEKAPSLWANKFQDDRPTVALTYPGPGPYFIE